MKLNIIPALILLFCALDVQGQKVFSIVRNDSAVVPLKTNERVYVGNKEDQLPPIPELKQLGKFILVGKRSKGYGIDVHAVKLEKLARQLGSNFIKVDAYRVNKKNDSLFVSTCFVPKEFLQRHAENFTGNQLIVINDSAKKERTVQIGAAAITIPPGSYYRHVVKGDHVSFRLGGGMISTAGNIDFKKTNRRYLKLGGYGLAGPAGGGVGLGVKSPDFAMLDNFTGELHLATLNAYLP